MLPNISIWLQNALSCDALLLNIDLNAELFQ